MKDTDVTELATENASSPASGHSPEDVVATVLGLVHDALCHRCGDTGTGFDIRSADLDKVRTALRQAYPHGLVPAGPPMLLAIDADCPNCSWAERWFDPERQIFGCRRCTYTSSERNA